MERILLITNARDESHILEWLVHHLRFDFAQILIWDHRSIHPILDAIGSKSQDPRVKIVRREEEFVVKTRLMQESRDYALQNGFHWMLYLDADEFLCLSPGITLNSLLRGYGRSSGQILLNWLMFGSNHRDNEEPGGTILSMYDHSAPGFDQHVKTLVRCVDAIRPFNPHAWELRRGRHSIGTDRHRASNSPWFHPNALPIDQNPAFIAHYLYQSYDTYVSRKVMISRDDEPNSFRPHQSREEIHSQFNDCLTTLLRDRYDHENRAQMRAAASPPQS